MKTFKAKIGSYIGINPKTWWYNTKKMLNLVDDWRAESEPSHHPKNIAVLVLPWLSTDVPWFSIVSGLFLARRGNKVIFIFDDFPFGKKPLAFSLITTCLRNVLKLLTPNYAILHLRNFFLSGDLSSDQLSHIERLAQLNAVWALRGEMDSNGRQQYIDVISKQLATSYSAIRSLMVEPEFDVIFIPGGVYGASGIWRECSISAGVRVASFDSGGYGTLMLAADGIAAQLHDIPRAFDLLKALPNFGDEKQFILDTASAEMKRRRAGTDKFASQMISKTEKELNFDNGVLIALNSSWDSAALGLHVFFENSTQWIVETTRWLIDNTDVKILIRQHPAERLEIARTSDNYKKLLTDNFGDSDRVHFIAADAPVNTYDLLPLVSTVLVYTSTIGVEAAGLGKVVITPSDSYYSELGFVWHADSKETYFKHLYNAIAENYKVTSSMKDDAMCCYYLTQCCNWVFTPFNPEGFSDWSSYTLDALYKTETVQKVLTSIQDNVPVAFLNHLENIEQYREKHGKLRANDL